MSIWGTTDVKGSRVPVNINISINIIPLITGFVNVRYTSLLKEYTY